MTHTLITRMSGAGESTLLSELEQRGHRTVDLDYDGWTTAFALWDKPRLSPLLTTLGSVILYETAENQGKSYNRLQHVELLSAPLEVLLQRVTSRTNNPYGAATKDRSAIRHHVEEVEPLLHAGAITELDSRRPVTALADSSVSRVSRGPDFLDSHATVTMRLRSNSIGLTHLNWL